MHWHWRAKNQHRWRRHAGVVLCDEGLQHPLLNRYCILAVRVAVPRGKPGHYHPVLNVRGEIRSIAQVAAAPDHRQVHTGAAALHLHGKNIRVLVGAAFHRLLVQHLGQSRDLVAHLRRLLESQHLGVGQHALLQFVQHVLGFAAQKGAGAAHISPVVGRADPTHARPAAPLDLVQQTWSGAVVEDRVLASAESKHLLQQQYGFLDRPGVGVRAEVLMAFFHRAAVI